MPTPKIDRDKLRAVVRRLSDGDRLLLLDRAIDLLPQSRLRQFIQNHARPEDLKPDGPPREAISLVSRARAFHDASLRGEYYESFAVNSRNCRERSRGTERFVADCYRLLDLCIEHARKGDHAEAAASFELIFAVLNHIDECHDDVLFFADEGGSWEVGVDWHTVFPAWFRSLAAVAAPEEFTVRVAAEVDHHVGYDRDRYLAMAREIAAIARGDVPAGSHDRTRVSIRET